MTKEERKKEKEETGSSQRLQRALEYVAPGLFEFSVRETKGRVIQIMWNVSCRVLGSGIGDRIKLNRQV